jgi:hypothetical protein
MAEPYFVPPPGELATSFAKKQVPVRESAAKATESDALFVAKFHTPTSCGPVELTSETS